MVGQDELHDALAVRLRHVTELAARLPQIVWLGLQVLGVAQVDPHKELRITRWQGEAELEVIASADLLRAAYSHTSSAEIEDGGRDALAKFAGDALGVAGSNDDWQSHALPLLRLLRRRAAPGGQQLRSLSQ